MPATRASAALVVSEAHEAAPLRVAAVVPATALAAAVRVLPRAVSAAGADLVGAGPLRPRR